MSVPGPVNSGDYLGLSFLLLPHILRDLRDLRDCPSVKHRTPTSLLLEMDQPITESH